MPGMITIIAILSTILGIKVILKGIKTEKVESLPFLLSDYSPKTILVFPSDRSGINRVILRI